MFKATAVVILFFLLFSGFLCPLLGVDEAIRVYEDPSKLSKTLALLDGEQKIVVRSVREGWVEVCLGETVGWVEASDFFKDFLFQHGSPWQTTAGPLRFVMPSSGDFSHRDSLSELFDFVFGNTEETRKMSDPHYREKIFSVSAQWGPLFQLKTRYYSLEGIHLVEMWADGLFLNLVKGRTNYAATFGSQWSSHLQDVVLKSNRGLLANRKLFGRGQSVFLEVRYSF